MSRNIKYTAGIIIENIKTGRKITTGTDWEDAMEAAISEFGEHNHTADCECPDCLNAPPNSTVSTTSGGGIIVASEVA